MFLLVRFCGCLYNFIIKSIFFWVHVLSVGLLVHLLIHTWRILDSFWCWNKTYLLDFDKKISFLVGFGHYIISCFSHESWILKKFLEIRSICTQKLEDKCLRHAQGNNQYLQGMPKEIIYIFMDMLHTEAAVQTLYWLGCLCELM